MILLFGDSWARQSWQHVDSVTAMGYQHWHWPDTWVENNVNDWFNNYFTTPCINFAEFGNTNDWIIDNLRQRLPMATLSGTVDLVVYQTDPLRIFAPRMDYTDMSIVWPRFMAWCQQHDFDWQQGTVTDLIDRIFRQWYRQLTVFTRWPHPAHLICQYRLWLVGGVGKLHPTVEHFGVSVLIPSVCEHFGLEQDTQFENRSSLKSFVDHWQQQISGAERQRLLDDYLAIDDILKAKERFWLNRPEYFAGRHLTARSFAELAEHIESRLEIVT